MITADSIPLVTANIDAMGRWKIDGVMSDGTWVIESGPVPPPVSGSPSSVVVLAAGY